MSQGSDPNERPAAMTQEKILAKLAAKDAIVTTDSATKSAARKLEKKGMVSIVSSRVRSASGKLETEFMIMIAA